jgi:hypothetical protein
MEVTRVDTLREADRDAGAGGWLDLPTMDQRCFVKVGKPARFALMGWEDDAWKAARDFAENLEFKLFRSSGQPASGGDQPAEGAPAS